MKLTKYTHACVLITKDDANLLIDPGVFSELPWDLPKIDVLVITHDHPDHLDEAKVQDIINTNPDVQIFGAPEVSLKINAPKVTVPETNQDYPAGPFNLRFYGGQHAIIHKDIPVIGNFGVCVDGAVYYPGDSFTSGPRETAVILAPAGAPWLKIGEVIDFISHQQAKLVIPTHDAVLSETGKMINDGMLKGAAEKYGGAYRRLQSGESLEL